MTLKGQTGEKYFVKYRNAKGDELWRMNEWISVNTEYGNLTVIKRGYFKLGEAVRDSLELDARTKYIKLIR